MNSLRLGLLAAALPLAACSGSDQPVAADRGDPGLMAALNGPLAADPGLASQNGANAAASLPSVAGSVPSLDTSPDAIARARNDALALVGGSAAMRPAPDPQAASESAAPEAALSVVARAAGSSGSAACANKAEYSAVWAARMPQAFPVYPRGAVQEAAGADRDDCALRTISFRTPVPVDEVIDFYFTQASKAGFSVRHMRQGVENVLDGAKGGSAYTVYARQLASGVTEVDLVTNH